MSKQTSSSNTLVGDRARDLIVDLEHEGIDSSRISVTAEPPRSPREVGRADGQAVLRPARRVVSGATVGAVIGLALGATIAMLVPSNVAFILLSTALGGLIIGGLTGLYRRLPMTAEVADIGADAHAVVRVNVEGLADLKADVAQRMVNVT